MGGENIRNHRNGNTDLMVREKKTNKYFSERLETIHGHFAKRRKKQEFLDLKMKKDMDQPRI